MTFLIIIDNDCYEFIDAGQTPDLYKIRIEDTIPPGFNYVPGSTMINGSFAPDPVGRTVLNWYYPTLPYKSRIVISYQLVIDENIVPGPFINNLDVRSYGISYGGFYSCDDYGIGEGVIIVEGLWDDLENVECMDCVEGGGF